MTVAEVTKLTGDASRGQVRFDGTVFDLPSRRVPAGADVGPELTAISKKFDRAGLIEAIVNPNAAIAFGYSG